MNRALKNLFGLMPVFFILINIIMIDFCQLIVLYYTTMSIVSNWDVYVKNSLVVSNVITLFVINLFDIYRVLSQVLWSTSKSM